MDLIIHQLRHCELLLCKNAGNRIHESVEATVAGSGALLYFPFYFYPDTGSTVHIEASVDIAIQQRENARLEEQKYQSQITQQEAEKKLAIDKAEAKQISALVVVEQEIIKFVTEARREQDIAKTKASEKLAVATLKLEAAKDEAEAIRFRGQAAADVIGYENKADAAGWKRAVEAFNGNGDEYAQFVLYQKLASAYRRIMVNTSDSPIMRMFEAVGENAVNTQTEDSTSSTP